MPAFFIGRQPIFDRDLNLYAYELLFRDGKQDFNASDLDHDAATSQVITTAFTDIGLEKLIGDKLAFVNVTHKFLTNPDLLPMQPEQVVLEVLENVIIDEDVVDGVKELSKRGFKIALDDFIYSEAYEAILPYVNLVKLDIAQIDQSEWQQQVEKLQKYDCELLAEKVETAEEYELLKNLDIDFFQGFFFARPKVVSGNRIASNKMALLQILAKVNDPAAGIDDLQELLSREVGLSVKALNFVNSAGSGLNRTVDSIREAIIFLGRHKIKNWVTLSIMASVDGKPEALMTTGLVRAKFCELLAAKAQLDGADSFFTIGLFSVLDSLMDAELEDVLEPMAIPDEMRGALLNHQGVKGRALSYAIEFEQGHFRHDDEHGFSGLSGDVVSDLYFEAMLWADQSTEELQN